MSNRNDRNDRKVNTRRPQTALTIAVGAVVLALAGCGPRTSADSKANANNASVTTPAPSAPSASSAAPEAGGSTGTASTESAASTASPVSPVGETMASNPTGAIGKRDPASSATAGTATPGVSASATNTAVGRTEREFLTTVAASGKAEVEAAKVAAERATNPQVKQFAQKMVQDHLATNDELAKLAAAKGVTLPAAQQDKGDKRGDLKRVNEAKGEDVDRQFLKRFGADEHKKDIEVFERAARESNDAEVRAFAEKTLPTLREHHQMAMQLQQSSGGNRTSGAKGSTTTGQTQTPVQTSQNGSARS